MHMEKLQLQKKKKNRTQNKFDKYGVFPFLTQGR